MIIIDPNAARAAGDALTPAQRALVREWTDYCHDAQLRRVAMIIDHDQTRSTSRWQCEQRARPWIVRFASTLDIATSSKTLEGALRLAAKRAKARQTTTYPLAGA